MHQEKCKGQLSNPVGSEMPSPGNELTSLDVVRKSMLIEKQANLQTGTKVTAVKSETHDDR